MLISSSGSVTDAWNPIILRDLSSNHTVIIFDNRGVGNTTAGTKPFSIIQFANDTAGLLDALKIQKADILGFSMGTLNSEELHTKMVCGFCNQPINFVCGRYGYITDDKVHLDWINAEFLLSTK